jgi:hypothetical protein
MTTQHSVEYNIIAPQLAAFGITPINLNAFLYKTSAVLGGGAVTHYLYNKYTNTSLEQQEKSDLDFWIYDPMYWDFDNTTKTYNLEAFHSSRAYRTLIISQLLESFPGFIETKKDLQIEQQYYNDMIERFRVQGGTYISVKWFINNSTGRTINLIFTSQLVSKVVANFDLPICRALIYGSSVPELMLCQANEQTIKDIQEKQLTIPSVIPEPPNYRSRIKKYIDRYGLVPRETNTIGVTEKIETTLT